MWFVIVPAALAVIVAIGWLARRRAQSRQVAFEDLSREDQASALEHQRTYTGGPDVGKFSGPTPGMFGNGGGGGYGGQ